jgi:hypothetical protein
MNRGEAVFESHNVLSSVVIDDLHVKDITALEAETHTPLIVDAYAPLPSAVVLQRFQPV